MANLLGQHFLKNAGVVEKIIAAVDPQAGETIIEIGPGHGELTIPLAAMCGKVGAKIIAVEKDARLAEALKAKFDEAGGNFGADDSLELVSILHADILEFLKTAASGKFKLVGNIPYYLTGHLLRIVSELETKPERAVFMIQKEVAERIAAEPPRMNRLAASVHFWAEPKIIASVPRSDFTPPPEVDSAVIELRTRILSEIGNDKQGGSSKNNNSGKYYAAVRALFAQPRKTVLNNLTAGIHIANEMTIPKNEALAILAKLDIDPKSRPQDLTIANILQIAENF